MKLFVDDLTHVDFSYLDAQRGLVGETWSVRLELEGNLNPEGMICDFGIVKKTVKHWFDAGIDHSLVVPMGLDNLSIQRASDKVEIHWRYPEGEAFYCAGPEQAFEFVAAEAITPDAVAPWCEQQLQALFPQEVTGLSISLTSQRIEGPFYHYSHGLQKHDGNCQRIAHGHRSAVQIFLDGQRNHDEERYWAARFTDIYIGTQVHLAESSESEYRFAYEAPQGAFALHLPKRCCYLINTESTVEQIGQHLHAEVQKRHPDSVVRVCAYEGIGKGSIAG